MVLKINKFLYLYIEFDYLTFKQGKPMSLKFQKNGLITLVLTCLAAFSISTQATTPPKAVAAAAPLAAADYAINKRMVIHVAAEEQAHVLTEMNDFLNALNTINQALATKDFETVAKTASVFANHGNKGKPAVELSFESKVPPEWKLFARPLRQGFGEVALAAKQDPTIENVMSKLAKTTQNCVACHATFKIVTP